MRLHASPNLLGLRQHSHQGQPVSPVALVAVVSLALVVVVSLGRVAVVLFAQHHTLQL